MNIIKKDTIIIGYAEDILLYLRAEIDKKLIELIKVEDENLIKDLIELYSEVKNNRSGLLKIEEGQMDAFNIEELE